MLKLIKLLKPYTKHIIVILFLVLLQTLTQLYLPNIMSEIVDVGIVQGNTDYIYTQGGLMLIVSLIGSLCTVFVAFLAAKTATGFSKLLRNKIFTRVESFSLNEYQI